MKLVEKIKDRIKIISVIESEDDFYWENSYLAASTKMALTGYTTS